jgi:N-acetylglutamate synthase
VKGRYVVRITPADVGHRVSVRSRTHGHPPATDTVGLLTQWSDGVLVVQRRDGSLAHILETDVLAAKTIPTAPPRTL